MKVIKFQKIMFYRHPIYQDYLASRCGKILSLKWNKTKLLKLQDNRGYLMFGLSKNGIKRYYVHRFVFETFKGKIPKGKEIDHIDNDRKNNSIVNLQLLTPKENTRKSCCKKVISFNLETKEKKFFNSLTEAAEYHQVHFSKISDICRKIRKTTKSKKDGKKYKFFYL